MNNFSNLVSDKSFALIQTSNNLFKNDLSFIEGDSIVYNDKNDKSFFLIKQINN